MACSQPTPEPSILFKVLMMKGSLMGEDSTMRVFSTVDKLSFKRYFATKLFRPVFFSLIHWPESSVTILPYGFLDIPPSVF